MAVFVIVQVVAVDSQNKNKKRNLALKIIIPIVVVAVIAGIWFFKTYEKPQEVAGATSSVTAAEESKKTAASNTTVTTTNESQETASSSSTATTTDETEEKINTDLVLEAREINLDKLKLYKLPIIIDFGADSCIPCKEMAPVLKKLNAEWQGKVIVKFVDVWKYPDAAGDFPLQVIPTQFFFDAQGNPYVPSDPEGMQMILYSLKDTQEHVYTAHQGGLTEQQIRAVFEEMGIK
jgi:thioredoxin 1